MNRKLRRIHKRRNRKVFWSWDQFMTNPIALTDRQRRRLVRHFTRN